MSGFGPKVLARALRSLAISCLAGFAVTACATTPQASSHMPAAGVAMPPAGLIDLCRRAPEVCGSAVVLASADTGELEATGATPPAEHSGGDGTKALRSAPDEHFLEGRSAEQTQLEDASSGLAETAAAEAPEEEAAVVNEAAGLALDGEGRLMVAPELFAMLNRVNQRINMQIRPRDDVDVYGVDEYWTLPLTLEAAAEGDCEDYALEKRQALVEAGVPDSALFLAVGYSLATGRHAVLVVSTDQGDYVLDNMVPHILPWTDTPYHWTARQMPGDLLSWRHMAALTS